jgi:hypothetical protein
MRSLATVSRIPKFLFLKNTTRAMLTPSISQRAGKPPCDRVSVEIRSTRKTAPRRAGLASNTARGKAKQKFSYPQAFENPRNGKIIGRRPGLSMQAARPASNA